MQQESRQREDARCEEGDARPAALQAEDGVVEREEGSFGAPQADVDEEERDPRHVEQVAG